MIKCLIYLAAEREREVEEYEQRAASAERRRAASVERRQAQAAQRRKEREDDIAWKTDMEARFEELIGEFYHVIEVTKNFTDERLAVEETLLNRIATLELILGIGPQRDNEDVRETMSVDEGMLIFSYCF